MSQAISSANSYKPADYEGLHGHEGESTSQAINNIAAHAGTTKNHALRGDDKTEREIHDESKSVAHNAKELGVMVGTKGLEHGAEHVVAHGVAVGVLGATAMATALAGGAVVEMLSMMKAVGEDGLRGHERAEAMTKDTMHCFLLGNLNGLPTDYRDTELAKYPASAQDYKANNLYRSMTDNLGKGDNRFMIVAQLHCDEGIKTAQSMIDAKQTKESYLASHPELGKRIAEDPAFKAGFEATVHASKDPETYKAVTDGLKARNAWYDQAHVQLRA